jgi:hypothetical protein
MVCWHDYTLLQVLVRMSAFRDLQMGVMRAYLLLAERDGRLVCSFRFSVGTECELQMYLTGMPKSQVNSILISFFTKLVRV